MDQAPETTTYDELFDAVERFDQLELVIERRRWGKHGSRLWMIIRVVEDGQPLHKAPVRDSIEGAALEIRRQLDEVKSQLS